MVAVSLVYLYMNHDKMRTLGEILATTSVLVLPVRVATAALAGEAVILLMLYIGSCLDRRTFDSYNAVTSGYDETPLSFIEFCRFCDPGYAD